MTREEFAEFKKAYGISDSSVWIYGLVDPRTDLIRYIGKSIKPIDRLANHCNEPPSRCHRSSWIQSLKREGLRPYIVFLESLEGEWPWQETERFWIAYGRAHGWPLTNNTDGGEGVEGLPEETRQRMRLTWLGRKHTEESRRKLRIARAKRKTSDATRLKMSLSQKGRKITWIDKISEANKKLTPAQQEEILLRIKSGEMVKDLAKEYGVHRTTISKVNKGKYNVTHNG